MFKQSKHRQQDPEAGQKSWGSVWAVPFHLAAAEADQDRPQFRGLWCVVCLQLPDHHAGHRRDKQAAGDGRSGLLLPLFQLLAVALEQFEITFNAPPPVVTTSQVFGMHALRRVGQQHPLGQYFSPPVTELDHNIPQGKWSSGNLECFPLTFFLAGRFRITCVSATHNWAALP